MEGGGREVKSNLGRQPVVLLKLGPCDGGGLSPAVRSATFVALSDVAVVNIGKSESFQATEDMKRTDYRQPRFLTSRADRSSDATVVPQRWTLRGPF